MPSRRQAHNPNARDARLVSGWVERDGKLAWPFPETRCSPVWQAWREAKEKAHAEAQAAWTKVGLQQLISAPRSGQRQAALPVRNAADSPSPARPQHGLGRSSEALALHFGPDVAGRLGRAALETLGDVAAAEESGRRWWAMAPGIGPVRAREIAQQVHRLLAPGE